jgi:predicted dithiol-disulfide oxidoreductase (DUF899 family)
MEGPRIVSRAEWLAARKQLLVREKEATRQRDALSAARRELPMVEIDKAYSFAGSRGRKSLGELFEGRRQLIVYHFMFDPSHDEGCKSCSYFADNFTGAILHLAARDTSFAVISRAPLSKIEPFKRRMGWTFPWYSSFGSDFNYDFHVTLDAAAGSVEYNYEPTAELLARGVIWQEGELPGLSVFLRRDDRIFHTYSTYSRGLDSLINTYNYLDLTPLGRQEEGEPHVMAWVRHHDKYGAQPIQALLQVAETAHV